ncbi:MAG: DUF2288 family protein [Xanthomonadales bacterium]|nr:DUF2288 domain-containing protein [Gammaproteobacteria bacterium]MBT8055004.1 DUF2288 domain-containing protein [Gammaproteobacteria bacterium]NND56386.1 DUF2288 family protein [Xanthomonadales bacterium]NNK50443.1 DUF2288 family protein [Xanthomonadales bacterium]
MNRPGADLHDLLNAQTGRVRWPELARHFARGVVICVSSEKDLVKMAENLVQDQAGEIGRLVEEGALHRAQDHDATRWQQNNTEFWAVVVAPWVLVQEVERFSL